MSKQSTSKLNIKGSTANMLLNFVIVLLGALILYMSYSIITKIIQDDVPGNNSESVQAPSNIIQVEVLNGCGVSGLGDRFTDYLRTNKFDVVNVSNYSSFDVEKTMVIDRTGNMANAKKVAGLLGISETNVIQQINDDYFLDVSLIIGRDFKNLKPFTN